MRAAFRFAARHNTDEPFVWATPPMTYDTDDDNAARERAQQTASTEVRARYPAPPGDIKYATVALEDPDGNVLPDPWGFAEYRLGIRSDGEGNQ